MSCMTNAINSLSTKLKVPAAEDIGQIKTVTGTMQLIKANALSL